MSHYDRDADIAWLVLQGFDGQRAYSEPQEWGLLDRDRETGSLVAVEFWRASERLPKELLEALPEPEAEGVVVTREDLAKRQPA
ncbi:MAG: DUF2283 domain-containing protein [Thermoleophilaceae bacterium]|nr:DUF2283 domain-containing protein [Thermoleophilaceae bacterium]